MKTITLITTAALASLAVAACERPSTTSTASTGTIVASTPTPAPAAAAATVPPVVTTSDSSSPNAPAVSTTTTSTATTGPNSANAVTDTVVSGKVKSAITADNGMKDADVSVKTENGVVTLTGTAKSPDQVTLAAALAQRQEGVNRVENQVAVK